MDGTVRDARPIESREKEQVSGLKGNRVEDDSGHTTLVTGRAGTPCRFSPGGGGPGGAKIAEKLPQFQPLVASLLWIVNSNLCDRIKEIITRSEFLLFSF